MAGRWGGFGIILAAAWLAAPAWADSKAGALIAQNGAAGASACMQCHGAQGQGQPAAGFPRLAGQAKAYLVTQLTAFKTGGRSNPIMSPMAAALNPTQISDVADYYASLPAWKPQAAPKPTAAWLLGERLAHNGNWDKGMPACFACHGVNGAGIAPHFPAIAGQGALYTTNQLKAWQGGSRHNDPQGLMKAVASKLSSEDVKAVSVYLENPSSAAQGVAP
jgi:cytochrome c553